MDNNMGNNYNMNPTPQGLGPQNPVTPDYTGMNTGMEPNYNSGLYNTMNDSGNNNVVSGMGETTSYTSNMSDNMAGNTSSVNDYYVAGSSGLVNNGYGDGQESRGYDGNSTVNNQGDVVNSQSILSTLEPVVEKQNVVSGVNQSTMENNSVPSNDGIIRPSNPIASGSSNGSNRNGYDTNGQSNLGQSNAMNGMHSFNQIPADSGMGNGNMMMGDLPLKKKKRMLVPIVIAVILLVCVLGGVGYKIAMSSPKVIFKNTINSVFREVNRSIDEVEKIRDIFDIENNAIVFRGDIKTDVKLDALNEFEINLNDYSFGGELGFDLKNELIQGNVFIKGESEKIEVNAYAQDGYVYAGSNLFEGLVREEYPEMADELEEIKKTLDEVRENYEIEAEYYDYVIEAVKKAIIDSLDSNKMSKESSSISVVGKDLKVTKYSYTFDEETLKNTIQSILDKLIKDEEFLDKVAKMIDEEKTTVKDGLEKAKENVDKNLKLEKEMIIHIYTNGLLNKTMGFGVEYDGKDYLHYYTDGENAEFIVYDEASNKEYWNITSVKKDNVDEVTVICQGEKIATLYVREYSEKRIDFDIEVYVQEETFKGTICLTNDGDDTKISGTYKAKVEYQSQYVGVEGTYGIESRDKLDKALPSKIITEEDVSEEEIQKKLEEIVNKDKALKRLYDFALELEKENARNEYGMKVVREVEDVKEVLNKFEGTVLYVGSPSTSVKSSDELDVLSKLGNFQNTYGFASYYYDYSTMPKELDEIFALISIQCFDGSGSSSVPSTDCTTFNTDCMSMCLEYPTVYFIKNGKVVRALRGKIDDNSIYKALGEIGIVNRNEI